MRIQIWKFLIVLLLLAGCKSDSRYLGYNYDADRYSASALINGRITNIFTGQAVNRATISIGGQADITGLGGDYSIEYLLLEDDGLNREVPIIISAINYHTLEADTLIFAEDMQLDFQLVYGAPIIEATTCSLMTYCQAILFDYQGVNNLGSVEATFDYLDSLGFFLYSLNVPLLRVETVSDNRAYYEALIDPYDEDSNQVSISYRVTATDKDGFTVARDHMNNPFNPDTLLFPPGGG